MGQQSWRELLGELIADPLARSKLASALGVNAVTLVRWANGQTVPRQRSLSALPAFLPEAYRGKMAELLRQELPELGSLTGHTEENESFSTIPPEFYVSVLEAVTRTSKEQLFFTVSNRVLTQMLGQLDPNNLGMAVSIAQCIPPARGQKVRSLREVLGRGTPPWQSTLRQEALFLGIESLAGYSLSQGRLLAAESRAVQGQLYAVRWEVWEESAVACPLMRESRFAGCLLVSSTQPGYFLPFRQTLVERYAQLLILAFDSEDFYDLQDIQLQIMPSYEVQLERMADFRQRLSQIILEASQAGRTINIAEAERLLWQQLEEELINADNVY